MSLDLVTFESVLAERLGDWRARRFCVAFSGGLDSMALLDLMAALESPRLRAHHVDHGLHRDSDAWRRFCAGRCEALGVAFTFTAVRVVAGAGTSPEAAARSARYEALRAALGPDEVLLTAHHADDQAETVLLQLVRGAGPAGLAAMPPLQRWRPGWFCRPLLGFERTALEAYARRRGLRWCDDPSNADIAPDRNYLRHQVMPILRARWPGVAATFARSARHSAAAARLIDECAAADLSRCRDGETLLVPRLRALAPDRAQEVLRRWVRDRGLPTPGSRPVARMLAELLGARPDALPSVDWPGATVRRYRDRLYLLDASAPEVGAPPAPLVWPAPAPLELGAGLGTLVAEPARGEGIAAGLLEAGPLEVRWRVGGERIRTTPGGPRRRVKSLLQEAGILPWMRDRLPLVYAGGELLAVGDLWVSGDRRPARGEAGFRIRWIARPQLAENSRLDQTREH